MWTIWVEPWLCVRLKAWRIAKEWLKEGSRYLVSSSSTRARQNRARPISKQCVSTELVRNFSSYAKPEARHRDRTENKMFVAKICFHEAAFIFYFAACLFVCRLVYLFVCGSKKFFYGKIFPMTMNLLKWAGNFFKSFEAKLFENQPTSGSRRFPNFPRLCSLKELLNSISNMFSFNSQSLIHCCKNILNTSCFSVEDFYNRYLSIHIERPPPSQQSCAWTQ